MDINSVFGKAVVIIAGVVLLQIVWMVFRSRVRGAFGETLLAGVLRRRLDASIYHVLNDIYLPLDDGSTTQIDHVVVSPFGVFVIETKTYKGWIFFVIETKTYKGWIFGNSRDAQWTQVLPKRKSRFQNPLRQNYLHVQRLMALTGLLADVVHSVVAFSGEATFKTKLPPEVMHFADVADYILSFKSRMIPQEDVEGIVATIVRLDGAIPAAVRKAHVANLRRRHEK